MGREEAREGKLGAFEVVSFAPIEAGACEVGEFEGRDLHGDGGAFEDGITADLVGNVFA